MYGWPDKPPSSIVIHKDCLTAEDIVRYKIRCEYCEEWFSSIDPDVRFCGFQCEHNHWEKRQVKFLPDNASRSSVEMTHAVRKFLDALEAKKQPIEKVIQPDDVAVVDDTAKAPKGPAPIRKIPQLHTDPLSPFVPRNKQGVVFLFGAAISGIGYHMLDIRASYPDATLISPDGLQIDMEFEYLSSNFILHKHDPMMCHLVVCWIVDKELPIPTIELSRHYDMQNGTWNLRGIGN